MKTREYGLNEVPKAERTLGPLDLGLIWAGISFCLPTFMIGALPVPAISWGNAWAVHVVGNLICSLLIILGGMAGVRSGLPAVILLEKVLGRPVGAVLAAALISFATTGWFAVMLTMTADGLSVIWPWLSDGQASVFTFVLGMLISITAAMGNRNIVLLNRLSLPASAMLLYYIVASSNPFEWPWIVEYVPTGESTWTYLLNLVIAGYLAGAICAADFARYARDARSHCVGVLWGVCLISVILSVIAMYSVQFSGEWNPVRAVLKGGFGIDAALVLIVAVWTTNQALVYSTGLALARLFGTERLSRLTLTAGIIASACAATGVTGKLMPFLDHLGLLFPPLLGVFLSRYFIVLRQDLSTPIAPRSILIISALLFGLIIGTLPMAREISSLSGLVAAGGIYYLLASNKNK